MPQNHACTIVYDIASQAFQISHLVVLTVPLTSGTTCMCLGTVEVRLWALVAVTLLNAVAVVSACAALAATTVGQVSILFLLMFE